MSPFLQAALEYYGMGFTPIPIRHKPGTKGKQPAISWARYQTTRPPEATVQAWFKKNDLDGLAIIVGPSYGGLGVRDFDTEDGYFEWAEAHAKLANTLPTSKTARGYHVFFVNANPNAKNESFDGGELKIARLYILVPPSRHPSGILYEWIRPLTFPIPSVDPIAVGLGGNDTAYTDDTAHSDTQAIKSVSAASAVYAVYPSDDRPRGTSQLSTNDRRGQTNYGLSLLERIAEAIEATLPEREGQRNDRIFKFARRLKAIPELANLEAVSLKDHMRTWHREALPTIETKEFDESWADFVRSWRRVKHPFGEGLMDELRANIAAMELPSTVAGYESDTTKRLVILCSELQKNAGEAPFFLSCRDAARICGFADHNAASKRLNMLVADKILEPFVADKPRQCREAASYRFVGKV